MEKFQRYIEAYDGSTDWDSVAELFDDAFADDCMFVTAEGEMDKVQWAEMAKGLRAKGAVASDFEVTDAADDAIYYKLTVTPTGGGPMHLAAKGIVREGRLVRVEPMDPTAYSAMVERSME